MLILLAGLAVHSAPSSEKAGQEGAKFVYIDASHFPDQCFRNYLLDLFPDGYIDDYEISVTTYMNVSSIPIADLTGIGYFTKLKSLYCDDCELTSLPELPNSIVLVTARNNKFTTLSITGKPNLTYLNLHGNTSLTTLKCDNNALTELYVSLCNSMTQLSCQNNQITSLGNSLPKSLKKLTCNNNALTTLNVSGCSALTDLFCDNNQLASLGTLPTSVEQLKCNNNALTTLNVSGCTAMTYLSCHHNQLTSLGTLPNTLKTLHCYNNALTSLNVSGFTQLNTVDCSNNNLTSLGTIPNSMNIFNCSNNQLTSLSVAGLTNLTQLYCNGNNLSSLSVEGCSSLYRLSCHLNQIKKAGMRTLVNSLRTIPEGSEGTIHVTYGMTDGNFFTNLNMSNTRQKRWKPYKYENGSWVEIVDINYDVNRDGVVDPEDANKITMNFRWESDSNADCDLNLNGYVDQPDLDMLNMVLMTNPMNLDVTPYKGLGDADGNGRINYRDYEEVESFILEHHNNISWECTDAKDVNGDGRCDWWDYFIVYFCVQNGWKYIRGDINGDYKVDVSDVNAVINIMLGKSQASDFPGEANVDGQGNVDVSDVNRIINIMLGKQ